MSNLQLGKLPPAAGAEIPHLTPTQKATIAVELLPAIEKEAKKRQQAAGKQHGRGQEKVPEKVPEPIASNESRDEAAAAVGVNPRYVSDAKKIAEAAPDVFEKMKAGAVNMSQAKSELRSRQKN